MTYELSESTPAERREAHELNKFLVQYAKHYGTLEGAGDAYDRMVLTGVPDDCQIGYLEVSE